MSQIIKLIIYNLHYYFLFNVCSVGCVCDCYSPLCAVDHTAGEECLVRWGSGGYGVLHSARLEQTQGCQGELIMYRVSHSARLEQTQGCQGEFIMYGVSHSARLEQTQGCQGYLMVYQGYVVLHSARLEQMHVCKHTVHYVLYVKSLIHDIYFVILNKSP